MTPRRVPVRDCWLCPFRWPEEDDILWCDHPDAPEGEQPGLPGRMASWCPLRKAPALVELVPS